MCERDRAARLTADAYEQPAEAARLLDPIWYRMLDRRAQHGHHWHRRRVGSGGEGRQIDSIEMERR